MPHAHRASVRVGVKYIVGTVIGPSTFDTLDLRHILIMTVEDAHFLKREQEAFVIMDGNNGAAMRIVHVYNGVHCSTVRLER